MLAIINEKQLTEEQVAQIELEEIAPEKFDPEIQFKINKQHSDIKREVRYRTMTREECAAIMKLSEEPIVAPPPERPMRDYPTYTREQVQELMAEHFQYKENEKKNQEERKQWDSRKTTESDTKTAIKPKRSKSTKA